MASRRDLFQSYQFLNQRVVSGLVLRETDPAQSPLRRMGGAVFGGVMIAVLALAAAGIVGVINPGGNTDWQDGDAVVVEEETGSRYVWLEGADGDFQLHPVVNFASGALLAGTTRTVTVSRNSLAGVERGPRLGIPDAPDALPPGDELLDAPWTLCSLPAQLVSGVQVPNTALVVGRGTSRGDAVGDSGVLVRDIEAGTLHLVLGGHQYVVPDEAPVLEGLALRQQPQLEVGTAWLNALPAGEPLAPRPVAGGGAPSAVLPGVRVGEVRQVRSGAAQQYYQVDVDRIREITEVQARLLLADPEVRDTVYQGQQPQAAELPAAAVADAPREELPDPVPTDPPAEPFTMAEVDTGEGTVCASFAGAGTLPRIAVQAAVDGAEDAVATERRTQDGAVLADRVLVEGGRGAVVASLTAGDSGQGSLFLVTDQGRRHAIPSQQVLGLLGYAGVTPVPMPASLVARIPAGAPLEPGSARSVA